MASRKCIGHNRLDLLKAFKRKNKPYLIIATTIKGFPLSFAKIILYGIIDHQVKKNIK